MSEAKLPGGDLLKPREIKPSYVQALSGPPKIVLWERFTATPLGKGEIHNKLWCQTAGRAGEFQMPCSGKSAEEVSLRI